MLHAVFEIVTPAVHKQVHRMLKVTLISYFKPELMLMCTMFVFDAVHSCMINPRSACPSRVTVHVLICVYMWRMVFVCQQ